MKKKVNILAVLLMVVGVISIFVMPRMDVDYIVSDMWTILGIDVVMAGLLLLLEVNTNVEED